jgi:hypothetical protein
MISAIIFRAPNHGCTGLTKVRSGLYKRIKYCLKIERRMAHDREHLGCGSQLLTCLVALAGEPRDVCYLVRSDGIWRIAVL